MKKKILQTTIQYLTNSLNTLITNNKVKHITKKKKLLLHKQQFFPSQHMQYERGFNDAKTATASQLNNCEPLDFVNASAFTTCFMQGL